MVYTFKLYSEDNNFISGVKFTKEEFFIPTKKLLDLSDLKYKEVIESLDYSINIFLPYNEGEDFVVENLSPIFKSLLPNDVDLSNIVGMSFNSFPKFIEWGMGDIINDVYKTGIKQRFKVTALFKNNLLYKFEYIFLKSNNKIFLLAKNITDYTILSTQEKEVFDNFHDIVLIVQDGKIVRVNNTYVKAMNKSKEELIGSTYNFDTLNFNCFSPIHWKKSFFKVLNKEILYYNFVGELTGSKNDLHYYDVYASYVNFNNKPAVQISATDITKEKEAKYDALLFKKALDIVQDISKVAIMYWDPTNCFHWTDEIFIILGLDKKKFFKRLCF